MVKLTMDMIARCTSGYTKKKRDESMQHYLKRLTHLYLEDRNIDDIGDDLAMCRNLTVLYLYDNKLPKVPVLLQNQNLTHLYLQNNHITRMENLAPLRRLTKLYLGGNSITVVEGLEKLDMLQEFHIENQNLPPGEKLLFDPRSLKTLSMCLQVLNVSGNNLDSIRELECLRELTQIMANDNNLNDMRELGHLLTAWRSLWRLELIGNPMCHKSKYRDRVIVMAHRLEILDGKEISDNARQFLENWQASKEKRRDILSRKNTEDTLNLGHLKDKDLPPVAFPKHGGIPGYIMPGLPRKQFDDILARSASLPNSAVQPHRTPKAPLGPKSHSDLVGPRVRFGPFVEKSAPPARYKNTFGTTSPMQRRSLTLSSESHPRGLITIGGEDLGSGDMSVQD